MFHTIAAVSTPPGKGGVALIRISGEDAVSVANRLFRPRRGISLADAPARQAIFGDILSPATGEILDSGVAILYRAPASYTGEDTAEITCHGGTAVTRAVLRAAFAAGAEPAGPGEFTRRAFLHGKLTLSEAEAVGLLIDADTESRRMLAAGAARGNLTRALTPLGDRLSAVLSAIYAAIDYPDEDIGDEGERQIAQTVTEVREAVRRLSATYTAGSAIAHGIPTVIAGLPNSGKSSLYNALLGREDAIVTDIPGTTRDILSAQADVGGVTLLLSDTAGIRDGTDQVEQIGVQRARERVEGAKLLLFVCDGATIPTDDLWNLTDDVRSRAPAAYRIAILNKSDAPHPWTEEERTRLTAWADTTLSLSAKTGAGLSALHTAIAQAVGADRVHTDTDPIIWDARQLAQLNRAEEFLTDAADTLATHAPLDAACMLCESALAEIRGVDGRAIDEEIVSGIFSRFCVGK